MIKAGQMRQVTRWNPILLALVACTLAFWSPSNESRDPGLAGKRSGKVPPDEFARLIRDFSEEGGYFRSDNFTSNETSYLHVAGKLREMHIRGGAYIGVGPEQNFTYIAKIRPQIAFIVDIRRQALIQHLMYKAVFHMSENPADFLSNLLSRQRIEKHSQREKDSIGKLLKEIGSSPAPEEIFTANLLRVRRIIQQEFCFPLSERDQEQLEYVYSTFHKDGLDTSFRSGQPNWWGGYGGFPTLKDLILQSDLNGNTGNFLAGEEDYRFVRNLQLQNRIIPVVGDFAGPKALAAVGNYLRKERYTVRAFYTSNVEQFLFQNRIFGNFVWNVRKLPISTDSVFIRSASGRGQPHPARVPGHRSTTLLQRISVFLKDCDDGAYSSYRDLVVTHYIAGP